MTRTVALLLWLGVLLSASSVSAYRDADQAVTYGTFKYVTAIATSATRAYFATTDGIIVFDKTQNRWEEPLTGADGLDGGTIKQIWVDAFDERLYARTALGLYEYDLTFRRWLAATDEPENSPQDTHIQAPAVMFAPFGFNYNGEGGLIDPYGRQYNMTDIVDDGYGNLWIGTWGYGVVRAPSASRVLELLPFGLIQKYSYALREKDSVLYLAGPIATSRRTGVTLFDLKTNSFQYLESGLGSDFPSVDIQCLDSDTGHVYVGTVQGLYSLSRTGVTPVERLDRGLGVDISSFTSVKVTGDSLFAGSTNGLFLIRLHSDSIARIGVHEFFNRTIYDLMVVGSYLWIASNNGAYRLSLVDGHLQRFQDPDKLLFNRVFGFYLYENNLWLSSDGGLVQINLQTGTTRPYRLLSRRLGCRPVVANNRIVATASDRGLTIVLLDHDEKLSIRDFSSADGVPSDNIYGLVLDGDYLWIATDQGLTRFWWAGPDALN